MSIIIIMTKATVIIIIIMMMMKMIMMMIMIAIRICKLCGQAKSAHVCVHIIWWWTPVGPE